ncbi:hypothetical protein ANCCEY_04578 [Ancylostoma ceylanicum]|uniref:Uncharacterized protein n=1 Tax=Ancylostoma ceylanicum TaxID=53326 RepID=A0A0D6M1W4_9BILA|nr:hypothetical protein ANCCEY_04578 [Ancylostoma ceylanicum]
MLTHTEIPQLLKRHHIVKGYRPLYQPVHYYYRSAFYSHNELINVWTHLVPAVCLIVYYFIPEIVSPSPRLPVLVLYTGVASLLVGSTLAHLLVSIPSLSPAHRISSAISVGMLPLRLSTGLAMETRTSNGYLSSAGSLGARTSLG